MLKTLRGIVQEVNSAGDLQTALDIIVRRVREAMSTQVCSVYLWEPDTHEYVLMATEGLKKSSIGRVRLSSAQGLVGLVGVREEPINLDDAPEHPNYQYFPETGEEQFHSFLGVPIIHHRRVLGVLVVQQRERRRFDEGEEAFLVTMSAQLAGVIVHAEATGKITEFNKRDSKSKLKKDQQFKGVSGAPGIAIGHAVVMIRSADLDQVPSKPANNIEAEQTLFREALEAVRRDIRMAGDKLADQLRPEEQALFDVYLNMLDDEALGAEVRSLIAGGEWAQGALSQVIRQYEQHFSVMDDPYLRERATDIRDMGIRLLEYMQSAKTAPIEYPDDAILVGEEITPTMLAEVPKGKLQGIVSVEGSSNSHVAILARAMGIPTIMGVQGLPYSRLDGKQIIIDGYRGKVFTLFSDQLLENFREIVEEEKELVRELDTLKNLPCETKDNHRIKLWVNTGLMADVFRSLDRGAEGVGLYRTEVPFMIKDRFPTEKEQMQTYREQLKAFAPSPVTMRTLDIGGDKELSYFPIKEDNPFLGWRGIRITLDHPEIFLVQVRAMMKASEGLNNLRIMLPMITGTGEVEEAMRLIHRAYYEVCEEGFHVVMPEVGVMIEVPAAVYQTRELAQMVDFISVGSNDLTQYILAVDRNNARVADLYHSYHPAVLQALKKIADDAHMESVQVSICGELAGDPIAAPILLAMGYDILSMNSASLPKVKYVVRNISYSWSQELLARVMIADSPEVIHSTIELALEDAGVLSFIRPQGGRKTS
ncbi:phosphoenolpyruvate--protein phosphotransferase [Litoribrevibacter albus]|uniref:phosphoenolpyruvate--protein phosphotransferase n=1 Tax=Litoribrevibacter albus TaxID=1473156 RepID=A0AA37WA46_9GAMM|nr:phosphoenolpyruvate--protein phosphotransferase [Litoribrevibacter albus]GLQ33146.1 phosphoenolpyruvate-protein phosphotransferase PtsP [Litoribrevibacter albus]